MIETIKARVVEKLKDHPNRLKHVEGVAETAVKLAVIHHADEQKAMIAGLWHDTSKYDPVHIQTAHLSREDIEAYQAYPVIYHAMAAVKTLEMEFDIHDHEILNAIRHHVWGHPDMGLLEKIIFVADSCEPNRGFEDSDDVFQLATTHLDEAVIYCMKQSIDHVIAKGKTPSAEQIQTYQTYLEEHSGKTEHID